MKYLIEISLFRIFNLFFHVYRFTFFSKIVFVSPITNYLVYVKEKGTYNFYGYYFGFISIYDIYTVSML